MCGTRASASLLSALEIDFNDPDEARLGSSVGSVFFPLRSCCNKEKVSAGVQRVDEFKGGASCGDSASGGMCGLSKVLLPCSNKRKDREGGGVDGGGANPGKAIEVESLDNCKSNVPSVLYKCY